MRDEDRFAVVPDAEPPDRPRVVDEAYEVLSAYAWQLTGTGGAVTLAWAIASYGGITVPVLWPVIALALLILLYLSPVTREPKLARDVLRRWDVVRVERALEGSGILSDPRLEVAESMADRVLRHPAVDERVKRTTKALIRRLKLLLDDLRRVRWLTEARPTEGDRGMGRSMSDLQDLLDARVADILGRLAELHRTVVLRDAVALERAVETMEGLLHELEAEREVDRLLAEAEGHP